MNKGKIINLLIIWYLCILGIVSLITTVLFYKFIVLPSPLNLIPIVSILSLILFSFSIFNIIRKSQKLKKWVNISFIYWIILQIPLFLFIWFSLIMITIFGAAMGARPETLPSGNFSDLFYYYFPQQQSLLYVAGYMAFFIIGMIIWVTFIIRCRKDRFKVTIGL